MLRVLLVARRRNARKLGSHRETVPSYVRFPQGGPRDGHKHTDQASQNRPNPPAGFSGPASRCEPLREVIVAALEHGLSSQRIWQDLRAEHGFAGAYDSVKRFCRRLKQVTPLRRMECVQGDEAQRDEPAVRSERLIARRMTAAAFRELRTLEDFDWQVNPSIKRKQLFDLATYRFIREVRDVLLLGPPGTGTSHPVQAPRYQATNSGFTLLYRSIFDAVRDFLQDEALGG